MSLNATILSAVLSVMLNGGGFHDDIKTSEALCLSEAIFLEAGNQPRKGKQAVASVIMNRVDADGYGNNVCQVVRKRGQFSYQRVKYRVRVDMKHPATRKQMGDSVDIALLALRRKLPDNTQGSLYFVNPDIATNTNWLKGLHRVKRIGDHVFYKKSQTT